MNTILSVSNKIYTTTENLLKNKSHVCIFVALSAMELVHLARHNSISSLARKITEPAIIGLEVLGRLFWFIVNPDSLDEPNLAIFAYDPLAPRRSSIPSELRDRLRFDEGKRGG